MEYNPQYHNRTSKRLRGYDYTQAGIYFITICTFERECLFGEIHRGEMMLNKQGTIAREEWLKTCEIRKNIELDIFVVMPNHIHGIIVVDPNDDACRGVLHTPRPLQRFSNQIAAQNKNNYNNPDILNPPHDLQTIQNTIEEQNGNNINRGVCNTPLRSPSANIGAIVRGYKSAVTKKIDQLNHCKGFRVWQRNYYDHIIRDHATYLSISGYIKTNPAHWQDDILYKG